MICLNQNYFLFKPVKPTAVRPLSNSQANILTTGSTVNTKTLLLSSTPSKVIPMTPSHNSPNSSSNQIATTNTGNFATVAASQSNSQTIHTASSKVASKYYGIFLLYNSYCNIILN